MSSEMVRVGDTPGFMELTEKKLEVLRNTVCRDHDEMEISLFLEYCRVRGFDPFSRMIYSTIRITRNGRQQTFQTGIDGMRSQAESSGKYAGQLGPFWCGVDGHWTDIWLEEFPPVAAKVAVLRHDFREPIWAVAKWLEYKPEQDWMWRKMPSNQLAKCAEALALRKAFPEKLAGLYSEDEMAQAGSAKNGTSALPESGPVQCVACDREAAWRDSMGAYCDDHKDRATNPVAIQDRPKETPREAPGRDLRPPTKEEAGQTFKEWLESMREAKKAVGEENYYRILKDTCKFAYKHANEVKTLKDQKAIRRAMTDCYRMMRKAQPAHGIDAFVADMDLWRGKLGDRTYYLLMGTAGYEKAEDVPEEHRGPLKKAMLDALAEQEKAKIGTVKVGAPDKLEYPD